MRQELQNEIVQEGLGAEVSLIGRRDEVREFLKRSDIFVLTSINEGFGVAVIEAMAAGIPCVVYDFPRPKRHRPRPAPAFKWSRRVARTPPSKK